MHSEVIELYPPTGKLVEHKGLYITQDLRSLAKSIDSVFVYANFIASLDGRIAVPAPVGTGVTLANQITNERDWRLFQELAVQADVLITSGRYIREYDKNPKQELLQVYDDPTFEDLGQWRRDQGLTDYPAVAVVSRKLDFHVPRPLRKVDRELLIFTTKKSDPEKRAVLESQSAKIVIAGEDGVSGEALVSGLSEHGYRLIYSTAGPRILHMLLEGSVLNRLYLTIANRILGGVPFSSIVEGALLDPPSDFEVQALFFDPQEPAGGGQFYGTFDHQEVAP